MADFNKQNEKGRQKSGLVGNSYKLPQKQYLPNLPAGAFISGTTLKNKYHFAIQFFFSLL